MSATTSFSTANVYCLKSMIEKSFGALDGPYNKDSKPSPIECHPASRSPCSAILQALAAVMRDSPPAKDLGDMWSMKHFIHPCTAGFTHFFKTTNVTVDQVDSPNILINNLLDNVLSKLHIWVRKRVDLVSEVVSLLVYVTSMH